MKEFNVRLFLLLTLLSACAATLPVHAQRKKSSTETPSSNARLREAEFFFTEAEKYFILEDYAKSLLYFQRVAELNPTNATVHYKLAEILAKGSKEEDMVKASQSIETALKFEKKNKYFYLLASTIYASLNMFDKATLSLETMLKEVKGTDEYLYELAALYLYDKKEEEALKVYNRAEAVLGVNEVSSLQKQRIYLDRGNVEQALAEGDKLLQAFPDEERYVLGFAETLSSYGQRAKAISYIEEFLKSHPESGPSKMVLAGLYHDDGNEEKSRALAMDVFSDPQVEVASKVLMLNTYTKAIAQVRAAKASSVELEQFVKKLFEQLAAAYPDDANVHLVGGDLFMTTEEDLKAKEQYLKAVRLGSGSFEAWQNLLYLDHEMNQIDSLIAHSEEALELFPNQGMVHYFNGYGHLLKKHYREAASSLEQAKRLSTSNPAFVSEINAMLGDSYNGSKDYAKSDKAYDESLAFNPNNDVVLNNYSYYLALRKENLEKAEKMSSQLVKSFPDNPSYVDTHAWVLYAREKYKEARRTIEKIITSGKASATHYEHYGDILFQLGEIDNAVTQWQKAKQQAGGNAQLDKKITNRRLN